MSQTRMVDVVLQTACKAGHVKAVAPSGERVEQIRHDCGAWTWADGNYCIACGEALGKEATVSSSTIS